MAPAARRQWLLWLLAITILEIVPYSICEDPCLSDIRMLAHSQLRNVEYNTTGETLCDMDTILPGSWYRVSPNDNEIMSEKCPEMYRCGTVYPIWLSGTYPTGDDVATMKVFMRADLNCTYWPLGRSNDVSVKRCSRQDGSHYYIYQLPNPRMCSSGFCTQKLSVRVLGSGIPNASASIITTLMETDGATAMMIDDLEPAGSHGSQKTSLNLILGPVIGGLALFIIIIVIVLMYRKKSKSKQRQTKGKVDINIIEVNPGITDKSFSSPDITLDYGTYLKPRDSRVTGSSQVDTGNDCDYERLRESVSGFDDNGGYAYLA